MLKISVTYMFLTMLHKIQAPKQTRKGCGFGGLFSCIQRQKVPEIIDVDEFLAQNPEIYVPGDDPDSPFGSQLSLETIGSQRQPQNPSGRYSREQYQTQGRLSRQHMSGMSEGLSQSGVARTGQVGQSYAESSEQTLSQTKEENQRSLLNWLAEHGNNPTEEEWSEKEKELPRPSSEWSIAPYAITREEIQAIRNPEPYAPEGVSPRTARRWSLAPHFEAIHSPVPKGCGFRGLFSCAGRQTDPLEAETSMSGTQPSLMVSIESPSASSGLSVSPRLSTLSRESSHSPLWSSGDIKQFLTERMASKGSEGRVGEGVKLYEEPSRYSGKDFPEIFNEKFKNIGVFTHETSQPFERSVSMVEKISERDPKATFEESGEESFPMYERLIPSKAVYTFPESISSSVYELPQTETFSVEDLLKKLSSNPTEEDWKNYRELMSRSPPRYSSISIVEPVQGFSLPGSEVAQRYGGDISPTSTPGGEDLSALYNKFMEEHDFEPSEQEMTKFWEKIYQTTSQSSSGSIADPTEEAFQIGSQESFETSPFSPRQGRRSSLQSVIGPGRPQAIG